jgi:hypothetical protein
MTKAGHPAYFCLMNKVIALSALVLVSACVTPKSYYKPHPYIAAQGITYQPVQPASVEVMSEPPACAFLDLGVVSVHAAQVTPSASTIDALKNRAALQGADAIILHANAPRDCAEFTLCPGKGEYNFATAIKYQ